MTRSLAAFVCFGAALFGAPSRSDAGVIPWMYDSIFGYGYGYGGGWGAGYRGGYMTGYAPSFYQPYYGTPSYGGGGCCGTTTNYAPWTGYYAAGGCCGTSSCGSCSPCGGACSPYGGSCGSCGSGCGTGCDSCGGCSGGNCGASSGTNTVPSTPSAPSNPVPAANPTYAPPAATNERTLPADEFRPSNNDRSRPGAGSTVPMTGGFNPSGTSNPTAEPNNSAPLYTNPAPAEPGGTRRRDDRSQDNGSVVPKMSPVDGGEKVAFKTPVRFTRTPVDPVFELPVVVSAPARRAPEPAAAATAVASK